MWDKRFLELAQFVSNWSKDPSTKVGAVITDANHRVISIGYNGFPIGVKDDDRLDNRDEKYKIIIHAEMNAILFSNTNLVGYTLYTYPFIPCPRCASMIIQAGIIKVVAPKNKIERWEPELEISRKLFSEAYIELIEIDQ